MQKRFQISNESMKMKSVNKTQFAGLNDKRYYFHDGIVSLLLDIFCQKKLEKRKKNTAQNYILRLKKTYKFLELEGIEVHLCERLRILRSIFSQSPMLYEVNNSFIVTFAALKNTRELTINGSWK